MKELRFVILIALFAACQTGANDVVSEFTGNETTYALAPGSTYSVSGVIVFKERRDGKVTADIQLAGTSGTAQHPVHLHLGNLSTPDAEIALLLNPVSASTGKSSTLISQLADESTLTYGGLADLEAAIKIHLGSVGPDRDVILAAGDVGLSFTKANPNSRVGIAGCKSE